ncbi:RES family NAD+ phosphorylase [Caballeronia sp. SEWSISQ10-4 2]|uniref:RES family NAD+ phosphorylase n=1 Tax=Caballeronia sp. SEWSISQ10-4 2 TaxID=2937438 RepID=UPI00264C2C9B|nr:RES family NAD+ phosphorylase [Caballeronia sp. SEWSISQ10-4 2]MDN7177942.1 RES family NAD+ phosphorylase [Caballeronia sp. SEWSISQ10-4 2]
MSVRILKAPDTQFSTLSLKIVAFAPEKLFRISSHLTGEPYFGKSASHRFDDPDRKYGTCYLGLNLATAVAESILHDLEPVQGGYNIAADKAASSYVHRFTGNPIRLADLTGHHLNVLGGHAELFGTWSYDLPMLWSRAVYEHPAAVDGFIYVSRLLTPNKAVVLFDHGTSLQVIKAKSTALPQSAAFRKVESDLNIRYV